MPIWHTYILEFPSSNILIHPSPTSNQAGPKYLCLPQDILDSFTPPFSIYTPSAIQAFQYCIFPFSSVESSVSAHFSLILSRFRLGGMESESASRRIQRIVSHLIANGQVGGGILHPMGCSGTSNSVIKRYDNMILFSRQGTSSQGYFMRQFIIKQFPDDDVRVTSCLNEPLECNSISSSGCDKKDFTSNASQDPIFGRTAEFQHGSLSSLEISQKKLQRIHSAAARTPQFSKPTFDCNISEGKSVASPEPQFSKPTSCYNRGEEKSAAAQAPRFAKATSGCNIVGQTTPEEGLSTGQIFNTNSFSGLEWSPRMDFAESGNAYVVTIELPGVTASDIHAEVDDNRLIISGKRSMAWWTEGNNKSAVYHKRELAEGPYRVVWPLPADSNRDAVSAEFVDGFLQIRIPKSISDMN